MAPTKTPAGTTSGPPKLTARERAITRARVNELAPLAHLLRLLAAEIGGHLVQLRPGRRRAEVLVELIDWIAYGFPLLPPTRGERLARVSAPHAQLWRCLFGSVIDRCGGDGQALRLGEGARRILGLELRREKAA